MSLNKYELMYILDPALEGPERKELIDRFTKLLEDNGSTVDKVDEWGKRRLAYPINFKNEGYYVLVNFQSGPDVPREIERNLRISDQVMRSLVVKIEEKRSSVKPRPVVVRMAPPAFAPPAEPAATPEAAPAQETDDAPVPEVLVAPVTPEPEPEQTAQEEA